MRVLWVELKSCNGHEAVIPALQIHEPQRKKCRRTAPYSCLVCRTRAGVRRRIRLRVFGLEAGIGDSPAGSGYIIDGSDNVPTPNGTGFIMNALSLFSGNAPERQNFCSKRNPIVVRLRDLCLMLRNIFWSPEGTMWSRNDHASVDLCKAEVNAATAAFVSHNPRCSRRLRVLIRFQLSSFRWHPISDRLLRL